MRIIINDEEMDENTVGFVEKVLRDEHKTLHLTQWMPGSDTDRKLRELTYLLDELDEEPDLPPTTAGKIISALNLRRGYDDLWDQVDTGDQAEILAELQEIIDARD